MRGRNENKRMEWNAITTEWERRGSGSSQQSAARASSIIQQHTAYSVLRTRRTRTRPGLKSTLLVG